MIDHYTRTDVIFPSSGTTCAAWLYRPAAPGPERRPVVVLGHGLGAVKEMGLDPYAAGFAAAGYIAVVFDYRHFGASGGEPRQLLDVHRQLDDWAAAIAFARALDGADPEKIALFGSSFGGGHVIAAGARDGRVAAIIAQCPFTSGLASSLRVPKLTSIRLGLAAFADLAAAALGKPPVLVPLAGKPGALALMSAPDVVPGYLSLIPPGADVPNTAAARIALAINLYYPGRDAAKLACPALFCVCDKDTVAPPGPTLRYAAQAPKGEIKRYALGHFDIYVGDGFRQAFADQRAFLQRHLPVAA